MWCLYVFRKLVGVAYRYTAAGFVLENIVRLFLLAKLGKRIKSNLNSKKEIKIDLTNSYQCLFIEDDDECKCSPHATGKYVDGRYTCKCKDGFKGDGFTCISKLTLIDTVKVRHILFIVRQYSFFYREKGR